MVIITMAWIMTEQKPKGVRYSENTSQATLWQFKTVIETGDLRYLLILDDYETLPEFDLELLNVAWMEIYQEFSDISGGNRADLWLVKVKRLTSMQLNYQRHASLLRVIKMFPDEEFLAEAAADGDMISLDDFDKTFEKAYTRLMRMKNQIGAFQREQEKEDTEESSLEGTIAMLEKFQGYQFDEYKMSVKKFANIYKAYRDAQVHKK